MIEWPDSDQALEEWIAEEKASELQMRAKYGDTPYYDWTVDDARKIVKALNTLRNAPYNIGRDVLTGLAMRQSLCPIHLVDWAICFDDEPEDCAQVRFIFPTNHDT